ncbi:hypothetical protein PIB30_021502 [Stylosanthes scabra]|uniref:Uncharacterized protein n=1 Tax=Stylosanthes scabra TaxID=79078 RepID=A0ABU6Z6C1_9FABA|nr:hypothetical protein [Stylosanthes scabra]
MIGPRGSTNDGYPVLVPDRSGLAMITDRDKYCRFDALSVLRIHGLGILIPYIIRLFKYRFKLEKLAKCSFGFNKELSASASLPCAGKFSHSTFAKRLAVWVDATKCIASDWVRCRQRWGCDKQQRVHGLCDDNESEDGLLGKMVCFVWLENCGFDDLVMVERSTLILIVGGIKCSRKLFGYADFVTALRTLSFFFLFFLGGAATRTPYCRISTHCIELVAN